MVNGKNIWRNNYEKSLQFLNKFQLKMLF
ncbi:MAG: hypothetical protein ACLS5G_02250 [Streptococcus sp.]